VRDQGAALQANVLISPHHGSKTSSTPEFVAAVKPQVVVHGAGWRNHFRHPRPEVTERYAAAGSRQFITGNSGAVSITRAADSPTLEVHEWRREAAKFWNAPPGP
jgi:competence protein ComEC